MTIQGKLNSVAILLYFLLMAAGNVSAQIFTNLHNLVFTNGTTPYAGLIVSGNTLYGTAENYGGGGNCGSVFRMNTDGSRFTNMYTFAQGLDGGNPYSGLALAGATMFGTVIFGGTSGNGCVFAINTNGTGLANLYSFSPSGTDFPYTNSDGSNPGTTLLLSGKQLYGTTGGGGTFGWGTAFVINTNGSGFANLHNFTVSDGQYPNDLLLAGGTLFGTSAAGGANYGGTIFKLNTNGTAFTKLYDFAPEDYIAYTNTDGVFPAGRLALSGNMLYGTTVQGGYFGSGTIFKIDTNGLGFTVLHQFSATNGLGLNADGTYPKSGLILWSNTLYGVAKYGGNGGCGTVFSLKTDGTGFTTLYSFTATNALTGTNKDGAFPTGPLAMSGSVLYGTASAGGTDGFGTIFSILFPPPLSIAVAGTNAIVSWPTNVTGFNLEATTNLSPLIWTIVSGQYIVTNPITGKQKYFRLTHP